MPCHDAAPSCLGIFVRIGLSIARCGGRSRGSVGGLLSSAGEKLSFACAGHETFASLVGNMGLLTSPPPAQHRGEHVLPGPPEGAVLKLLGGFPLASCIGVLPQESTGGCHSLV